MSKFVVKRKMDENNIIEFSMHVDDDGDLIIEANGVPILCMYNCGTLDKMLISEDDVVKLSGIKFDKESDCNWIIRSEDV